MRKFDESKLVFVPLVIATRPPPGIVEHLKDRWWVVHPEKGVVYFRTGKDNLSPQCNGNEEIARRFLSAFPEWAEVVLIPSVFRKINPRDYA